MKVIDPGHKYALAELDGDGIKPLTFVKRDEPPEKYPGNEGHYPGVIIQEVLRALIDRVKYLDAQISHRTNQTVLGNLREALFWLEVRTHDRHGMALPPLAQLIETYPACPTCGHIFCSWCAGSGGDDDN